MSLHAPIDGHGCGELRVVGPGDLSLTRSDRPGAVKFKTLPPPDIDVLANRNWIPQEIWIPYGSVVLCISQVPAEYPYWILDKSGVGARRIDDVIIWNGMLLCAPQDSRVLSPV